MTDATPPTNPARAPRELLAAAREFAVEHRGRSWFHLAETMLVLGLALTGAALLPNLPLRLLAATFAGFVGVRFFILYHDYQHGAILRDSKLAEAIFWLFGLYVLTPKNVWKQTHNYHHAHTAKIVGSHVGSYLMVTTEMWAKMSPKERLVYKLYRHPLTVVFAYLTVFLYGMCVSSFLRNKRKNWDSLVAVLVHVGVAVALPLAVSLEAYLVVWLLPLVIATMVGAYLFYAQHNYPDVHVQPRESWEYTRAALESSSYMETGPVLRWLTGNIGYHHVHHLNPSIPFYRLPETMAAIEELQHPGRTDLSLREIARCFSLKLWDAEQGKMVGYPS